MLIYLVVLGIFILGFVNRAFHLFRHPWVGKDTFSHLWVAKEIREKGKFPRELWGYRYTEPYNLPPFPHIFLALWPERFHRQLQYLAPLLDTVTGLIVFVGCLTAFDLRVAAVALAFYYLTPMGRDNYYSLGPRAFGNTFLVATLFSLFVFYETSWPPVLIVASVFSALVFLTHRLTLQSLMAVLIALTIGLKSLAPLVVLIVGFIMAMVFSKGYLIKVLKGHLEFVTTVATAMKDPAIRAVQPAVLPNPVHLIFNLPLLGLLPFFFLSGRSTMTDFFLIWGVALLALSIIWILGEGYRHLANAVAPFSILAAVWLVNSSAYYLLAGLLAISLFFTVVKIWRLEKEQTSFVSEDLIESFRWLKRNCQPEDMVLCLPFDIFQALFYFTECKILQAGGPRGMLYNRSVLAERVKDGKINELIEEAKIKWIFGFKRKGLPGTTVFTRGDVIIKRI